MTIKPNNDAGGHVRQRTTKEPFNDYANGLITEREYRRYILAA